MSYPSYLVHFNKNHDKKGRFTYGDGDGDGKGNDHGRRDGEGSSDSPNSKYSSSLNSAYEHEQSGGLDKSFNLCVKALKNMGSIGKDEEPSLDLESEIFEIWPGYKSIAYLAGEGYDKSQIKDIMEVNHVSKVNEYLDYASSPYHKNFDKNNDRYKELEEYIDECVKLAKDMEHSDSSDYLVHFNKNHDKLGRFAIGDGDGDGIRDDHSNQDKETAGQKIKRAVDTYDSVRSDIRRRNLEDEEYKVKKGNLNLRQDQIANQRNQEQTDVKSRNIDLSLQKQDARLQKLQMKNAMREERARAFIEKHRMKQELKAEKQAERMAKAQERAAKAQERAAKTAERNERRELERQAAAQQRAIKEQQRQYAEAVRQQQAIIDKYNSGAKKDRTKAMIGFVLGNPIYGGIKLGTSIYKSSKAKSLGGE